MRHHEALSKLLCCITLPHVPWVLQNAVVFHSYGSATRFTNGNAAADACTPLPYYQVFLAGWYGKLNNDVHAAAHSQQAVSGQGHLCAGTLSNPSIRCHCLSALLVRWAP